MKTGCGHYGLELTCKVNIKAWAFLNNKIQLQTYTDT